ncbi:MAG: hypothetical protein OHK0046_40750 [Anaerolineae bacterium]
MRRILIFVTLILILVAVYRLSLLASGWHYVVPAPPGELLYLSTFDPDTTDWEQDEGFLFSRVADGLMLVGVDEIGEGIYSAASPYFRNFDFSVEVNALEGPLDNGFGVVFRQRDRQNYYTFFISSDGFYRVERVTPGATKVLSEWHTTPLVNQGLEARNTLRVIGYEDRFQFFINGEQVELCIPDSVDGVSTPLATGECLSGTWQTTLVDDSIRFGRLGVAAAVSLAQEPGVRVGFDNVIVLGPEPIPAER